VCIKHRLVTERLTGHHKPSPQFRLVTACQSRTMDFIGLQEISGFLYDTQPIKPAILSTDKIRKTEF